MRLTPYFIPLLLWMLPQSLLAAAPTYYTPKSMGGLSVGLRAPNIKADSTLVLPVFSSAPSISALRKGDLYYNAGDSTVYRCTGGSWAAIGLNGIIPVANGGTGVATLAANGVLYGNGTGVVLVTPAGTASKNAILTTSTAGLPVFSTSPSASVSFTTPILKGGTAVGSTLTLKSTSGVGTTDAILFTVGNNGGTAAGRITDAGAWFIGATTTNTNTTNGLTIDQGANDNEVLTFKSTDVAHGMTAQMETSTYGSLRKIAANGGGIFLNTATDAQGTGPVFEVYASSGVAADATHTVNGQGIIILSANLVSGTDIANVGTNGNLLTVADAGYTRFIVDKEGDLFADGSDVTVYDDYDDVAAISSFDKVNAEMSNKKLVDSEWEDYTKYNEKDLIAMDILGGPRAGVAPEERGLVNYTGLVRLHNGAIRQLGRSVNETESTVETLGQRVSRLEAQSNTQPAPSLNDVWEVFKRYLVASFNRGRK